MSKSWKLTALVVVLCVGLLATSCYGPFNATRRFHHWNGDQSGKWCDEGIFIVLGIVYPFCVLGDSLIFNSIEFWGGTNPIDPPSLAKAAQGEMDQVAAVYGLPYDAVIVSSSVR